MLKAYRMGDQVSSYDSPNMEDPIAFDVWLRSLSGDTLPGGKNISLAQKHKLEKFSKNRHLETKFALNRIISKDQFNELLNFEIFDRDKHGNDVANLPSLFMK